MKQATVFIVRKLMYLCEANMHLWLKTLRDQYYLRYRPYKITKATKSWLALPNVHKDCFCRHTTLYEHMVSYGIFKFRKWPLGGILQNSWPLDLQRQSKNTYAHLLSKTTECRRRIGIRQNSFSRVKSLEFYKKWTP